LELTITLDNPQQRVSLFGPADTNLRLLRELCQVRVTVRDGRVTFRGGKEAVNQAAELLERMQRRLERTEHLSAADVKDLMAVATRGSVARDDIEEMVVYAHGRTIGPRTPGQKHYLEAIRRHDMVFCTGPAGTGKTYLAVAMAVSLLKQQRIRRIILARPAVEAGEKLGFLPGDLQAKVNPYLRPLFDALGDMMEFTQVKRFLANDVIEVVPLAFMRGRTLNQALVILDEAQNTTIGQMLMFLTRMGHDSKMIITGDDSQVDLPDNQPSGLVDALQRLKGIKGIAFVRLTEKDIVRHRLVQTVVKAYERNGTARSERLASPRGDPHPPGSDGSDSGGTESALTEPGDAADDGPVPSEG